MIYKKGASEEDLPIPDLQQFHQRLNTFECVVAAYEEISDIISHNSSHERKYPKYYGVTRMKNKKAIVLELLPRRPSENLLEPTAKGSLDYVRFMDNLQQEIGPDSWLAQNEIAKAWFAEKAVSRLEKVRPLNGKKIYDTDIREDHFHIPPWPPQLHDGPLYDFGRAWIGNEQDDPLLLRPGSNQKSLDEDAVEYTVIDLYVQQPTILRYIDSYCRHRAKHVQDYWAGLSVGQDNLGNTVVVLNGLQHAPSIAILLLKLVLLTPR